MLVTADTIREVYAVSRATAFRRMSELVAAVARGEHPGACVVDVPVVRGNGAPGIARGVRFPAREQGSEAA